MLSSTTTIFSDCKHLLIFTPSSLCTCHINLCIRFLEILAYISRKVCFNFRTSENRWLNSGCRRSEYESNDSYTVCYCDHLTNFAVLMDIYGIEVWLHSHSCIYPKYFDTTGLDRQTFSAKIANIFLPISFKICFVCSKELSHWYGSLKYTQHMLWLRKKKIFLVTHF